MTYRFHLQGQDIRQGGNQYESSSKQSLRAACLAYSSALEMKALCSFEMSVDFHLTTRRYIPEEKNIKGDFLPLIYLDSCFQQRSMYVCNRLARLLTAAWE
jgi:hypothetical protein